MWQLDVTSFKGQGQSFSMFLLFSSIPVLFFTVLNEQWVLPWASPLSQSTHRQPSPVASVSPNCSQSRRYSPLSVQTADKLHMRQAAAGS